MNDAELVSGLESLRNLFRDRQRFVEWNGSASDPLGQILTLDQFDHERPYASAFLEAVNRRDVRMIQRREGLGFTRETGEPVLVTRQEIGQHFDGDVAIQLRVMGAIDLAHAARADQRDDFVRTEASSGGQTHERR